VHGGYGDFHPVITGYGIEPVLTDITSIIVISEAVPMGLLLVYQGNIIVITIFFFHFFSGTIAKLGPEPPHS
jgi:hypothetical protein